MNSLQRMTASGLVALALAGCDDNNSSEYVTELYTPNSQNSQNRTIDNWISPDTKADYVVFAKSVGKKDGTTDCGFCEQTKPHFERLANQFNNYVTPEIDDIDFNWINVTDSLRNLSEVQSGIFQEKKGAPHFGIAKITESGYVISAGPMDFYELRAGVSDYFVQEGFSEAEGLRFDPEVPSAQPGYFLNPHNFKPIDVVFAEEYSPKKDSNKPTNLTLPVQYGEYFGGVYLFEKVFDNLKPSEINTENQNDALLHINSGLVSWTDRGISGNDVLEMLKAKNPIPLNIQVGLYIHPGVDNWINQNPSLRDKRIEQLFQGYLPIEMYNHLAFIPDISTDHGLNAVQGICEGTSLRFYTD